MFEATLKNRHQPELGALTVTFPIPEERYENVISALKKLQIGDAVAKDCFIEDMAASRCPTLYRLIESSVNLDELDWLGKRLESFNQYGLLQYQAAADAWELSSIADLIDLTFYAPRTTVISDFSELDQIGRQHYRTVYGAGEAAALKEQEGVEVILNLLEDETGRITRFGVFYDNDLVFQPVYDRKHLPGTVFTHDCMMEVEIRPADQPSAAEPVARLQLPVSSCKMERELLRAGMTAEDEMSLRVSASRLPEQMIPAKKLRQESLSELNRLCHMCASLSEAELFKLERICQRRKPECAAQVRQAAEQLSQLETLFDEPQEHAQQAQEMQMGGMS